MRRLQRREQVFVVGGAVFVIVVLLGRFVQGAVVDRLGVLDRQIAAREADIEQMERLVERHRRLHAQLGALELKLSSQEGESFLSRLNQIIGEVRLGSHLDVASPQGDVEREGFVESTVEVKFSRVTLGQILGLLERLSLGNAVVNIQRLSIDRRFENPSELDVSLVLASYQPKR